MWVSQIITSSPQVYAVKFPLPSPYTDRNRLNLDIFRNRLTESSLFSSAETSVDGFCTQLKNVITDILDDLIPIKTRSMRAGKRSKIWLSNEDVKAKRIRGSLSNSGGHQVVTVRGK